MKNWKRWIERVVLLLTFPAIAWAANTNVDDGRIRLWNGTQFLDINSSGIAAVRVPDNGLSTHRFIANGSTVFTNVTSASTVLYHGRCYNLSTTAQVYVKLYNKATAPTGSDTPISTDPLPAGDTNKAGGIILNIAYDGVSLSNGFGYAVTGALADSDTSAAVNNTAICNFAYRVP